MDARLTTTARDRERRAVQRQARMPTPLVGPWFNQALCAPNVTTVLALQRAAGNRATAQLLSSTPVQRVTGTGRLAKKSRRKRRSAAGLYASFVTGKGVITRVKFGDRPPSNSRRGQGDHIVAFTLVKNAMATAVEGKAVPAAGAALADLVGDAADSVKDSHPNRWWHDHAKRINKELRMARLGTPTLQERINDVASLLNLMPGSAVKNERSTGGRGEGSSKGGLEYLERQVARGKPVPGNVWKNVFGLFDVGAQSKLLEDREKLEQKIEWLMTLVKHAAPTVLGLLKAGDYKLMPDSKDLKAPAKAVFGDKSTVVVKKVRDILTP